MHRLLLATLLTIGLCDLSTAAELARTISVAGQGEVHTPPDVVFVHTGVESEASEAQQALAQNTAAMNRIFVLLEQRGVAERDRQTVSFTVSPLTRRSKTSPGEDIIGYRVINQLRVRLRDTARLGEMLDALVAAGSNRVSGVEFALDDAGGALDEARRRAVADARARAELYADSAGVKVGSVVSISEQQAQIPGPQRYARQTMFAEAAAVPIAPGAQTIHASVVVVYTLLER